jgi:hypothetical protein
MVGHRTAKSILPGFVCLCVAPVIGVWAGGSMPNPPGNGPGSGQVVVGAAVPVTLTFLTAAVAGIRPAKAFAWAVVSLALTGSLVLFLAWFVRTYIPT